MTHFFIFLAIAAGILYGPRFLKSKEAEPVATSGTPSRPNSLNTYIMKLIGGPANGHVEKIVEPERPLFFVATYPPEADEETGMPPQENIVGHMYGKLYVRPNYAYYRYVLEDEYVYVRDLDEKEVQNIAITGEQPEVKPRDQNAEEDNE